MLTFNLTPAFLKRWGGSKRRGVHPKTAVLLKTQLVLQKCVRPENLLYKYKLDNKKKVSPTIAPFLSSIFATFSVALLTGDRCKSIMSAMLRCSKSLAILRLSYNATKWCYPSRCIPCYELFGIK